MFYAISYYIGPSWNGTGLYTNFAKTDVFVGRYVRQDPTDHVDGWLKLLPAWAVVQETCKGETQIHINILTGFLLRILMMCIHIYYHFYILKSHIHFHFYILTSHTNLGQTRETECQNTHIAVSFGRQFINATERPGKCQVKKLLALITQLLNYAGYYDKSSCVIFKPPLISEFSQ